MDAYNRLLEHGVKPSMQRIAVMDYLMKNRTHPTVDEIYSALSPKMPTLSKTTVYNTLKLLSEQGAAQMLTIDEKNVCFDADTTSHAHFLCKECGRIYDLSTQVTLRETYGTEIEGHSITEIHYYYKGICSKCLKK